MGQTEESLLVLLQKSGLARSVLPAQIPYAAVWPPITANSPLWTLYDDLLGSIRRRVRYRRLAISAQLGGLCVVWLGTLLSKGYTLTLIGVTITLAGAALAFIDKDRLTSIDNQIEQLLKEHRAATAEWLLICLEIGPYSYTNTSAAGVTKSEILSDRRHALTPNTVYALLDWLKSAPENVSPSQHWSTLSKNLTELQTIDEAGRLQERRLRMAFDAARVMLLTLTLAAAVAIPTLGVPQAVLATLVTFVVLGTRGANDIGVTIVTRSSGSRPPGTAPDQSALVRRVHEAPISDLDETTLKSLTDLVAVIPRSLLNPDKLALKRAAKFRHAD